MPFEDLEYLPLALISALWLAEELQMELAVSCRNGRRLRKHHRESAAQLRADRKALEDHFGIHLEAAG